MAEVLFILTTVFVAYVVFVVVDCEKRKKEEARQAVKAGMQKSAAQVKTQATAKPTVAAKPVEKKPAPTPAPAAPAPKTAAPASAQANTLKNPETGEEARVPNNYRFAKRWIKEALVSEGLLEKIYKNNELDDAATAKIQSALEQLKAMPKYQ